MALATNFLWRKKLPEPLYKQVSDEVIRRIVDGQYPPGSILPSEFDLAADMNVSQGTARKAFIDLEASGVVERRQGKGTFVTLRTPENSLFHFFRLRTLGGEQVVPSKLHEKVIVRKARKEERSALYASPDRVFEVSRIRTYKNKIVCQEISIVAEDRFPGLKERSPLPNTLYVLFQQAYSCIRVTRQ